MNATYCRYPPEEYLIHYGMKGQKWRTHQKERRWQNHAVYAIGDQRHSNGEPMTRQMKKDIKKGKKDATTDFRLQMIERGSFSDAMKLAARNSTALTVLTNSTIGSIYNHIKTGSQVSSYKTRHPNAKGMEKVALIGNKYDKYQKANEKRFNDVISNTRIKKLQLSKEYVDSYHAQMQSLINSAKTREKLNKLREKYGKPRGGSGSPTGGLGTDIKGSITYNYLVAPLVAAGVGTSALLALQYGLKIPVYEAVRAVQL